MAVRRGASVVAVVVLVALAAACQGTPRDDFNDKLPVMVPSWAYDTGIVLRAPDGSTFASHFDPATGTQSLRKLAADGSVVTGYGTDGSADTAFQAGIAGSGANEGTVLADGSVILNGDLNRYWSGTRKLTPTGSLDPAYGDAGTLVTLDGFNGTGWDRCGLEDSGSLVCAAVPSTTSMRIGGYDAGATPLPEVTVATNFGQFARPGPPGTATTRVSAYPVDVRRDGAAVVVALQVASYWTAADLTDLGGSESDLVVVRVAGGALDPTFGSGGYALVDAEVVGGDVVTGAGDWDVYASTLEIGSDHRITFGATVQKWDGVTVTSRSIIGRLDATGVLDPAWAGDGLVLVVGPDGSPVEMRQLASRAGISVTAAGSWNGQPVVLRYTGAGGLIPEFAVDGAAAFTGSPSFPSAFGLDLRNGTVTVSYLAADPDPVELTADLAVVALYG